jgi:excisionase family DNA binding protein
MDKPLKLNQLCDLLQLSRSTIDRWRKEGLPCTKMGRGLRFDKKKVNEWIKQNKQSPAPVVSLQSGTIKKVHQVMPV